MLNSMSRNVSNDKSSVQNLNQALASKLFSTATMIDKERAHTSGGMNKTMELSNSTDNVNELHSPRNTSNSSASLKYVDYGANKPIPIVLNSTYTPLSTTNKTNSSVSAPQENQVHVKMKALPIPTQNRAQSNIGSLYTLQAPEEEPLKPADNAKSSSPTPSTNPSQRSTMTPAKSNEKIDQKENFRQQMLKLHNYFRHLHGSPSLTLDDKLNKRAQSRAVAIAKTEGAKKSIDDSDSDGENVYTICHKPDDRLSISKAYLSWYRQVCRNKFQFSKDGPQRGTRKFAQVIWKPTKKFGIDYSTIKRSATTYCTYVVARYSPGSNEQSQKENVPKGKFDGEKMCGKLSEIAASALNDEDENSGNVVSGKTDQGEEEIETRYPSPGEQTPTENVMTGEDQVGNPDGQLDNKKKPKVPVRPYPISWQNQQEQQQQQQKQQQQKQQDQKQQEQKKQGQKQDDKTLSSLENLSTTGQHESNKILAIPGEPAKLQTANNVAQYEHSQREQKIQAKNASETLGKSLRDKQESSYEQSYTHRSDNEITKEKADRTTPDNASQKESKMQNEAKDAQASEYVAKFQGDTVKLYNVLRTIHKSPPLGLYDALSKTADERIEEIMKGEADITRREGKEGTDLGENFYVDCNSERNKPTAKRVVENWYHGVCDYKEDSNTPITNEKVEKFMQMIWKTTSRLGIAVRAQETPEGLYCTYILAKHFPPRTDSGVKENVMMGSFDKAKMCDKNGIDELATRTLGADDELPSEEEIVESQADKDDDDLNGNEDASPKFQDLSKNTKGNASTTENMTKSGEKIPISVLFKPGKNVSITTNQSYSTNDGGIHARLGNVTAKPISTAMKVVGTPQSNSSSHNDTAPPLFTKMENSTQNVANVSHDNYNQSRKEPDSKNSGSQEVLSSTPIEKLSPEGDKGRDKLKAAMETAGLLAHNTLRKIHDSSPLELDNKMSEEAEVFAKKLAEELATSKRQKTSKVLLRHSDTEDGENLAMKCDDTNELSAEEATQTWYSEQCTKPYDFAKEGPQEHGHFTQVVWKSSKRLGIGRATFTGADGKCTVIVARYRPAGNFMRRFRTNVDRASFQPSVCSQLNEIVRKKNEKTKLEETKEYLESGNNKKPTAPEKPKSKSPTISSATSTFATKPSVHPTQSAWASTVMAKPTDLTSIDEEEGEDDEEQNEGPDKIDKLIKEAEEKASHSDNNKDREHNPKESNSSSSHIDKAKGHNLTSLTANSGNKNVSFTSLINSSKINNASSNIASNSTKSKAGQSNNEELPKQSLTYEHILPGEPVAKISPFEQSSPVSWPVPRPFVTLPTNTPMATLSPFLNATEDFTDLLHSDDDSTSFLDNVKGKGKMERENAKFRSDNKEFSKALKKSESMKEKAPSKEAKEALEAHNILREIHGVPPLILDNVLSAKAEKQASETVKIGEISDDNSILQSIKRQIIKRVGNDPNSMGVGKNVMVHCNGKKEELPIKRAILLWYKEVCRAKNGFEGKEYSGQINHFTQIVWKTTTGLGIGKATLTVENDVCTVIIAFYRPAGNKFSQFKDNVPVGKFDHSICLAGRLEKMLNLPYIEDQEESQNSNKREEYNLEPQEIEQLEQNEDEPDDDEPDVEISPTRKQSPELENYAETHAATTPTLRPDFSTPRSARIKIKSEEKEYDSTAEEQRNELEEEDARKDNTQSDFAKQFVTQHNKFREVHGSPPLALDEDLTKRAAAYAKQLAQKQAVARSQVMSSETSGESIYTTCEKTVDKKLAQKSTTDWYKEACDAPMEFAAGKGNSKNKHFTQMIWRDTRKLGIGRALFKRDNKNCQLITALYYPEGNIDGKYKQNVMKGSFDNIVCARLYEATAVRRQRILNPQKTIKQKDKKKHKRNFIHLRVKRIRRTSAIHDGNNHHGGQ